MISMGIFRIEVSPWEDTEDARGSGVGEAVREQLGIELARTRRVQAFTFVTGSIDLTQEEMNALPPNADLIR